MYMSIEIINEVSPKVWSFLICASPVKGLPNDLVERDWRKKVASSARSALILTAWQANLLR